MSLSHCLCMAMGGFPGAVVRAGALGVVHDPHLEYILRWVPELRSVAEQRGPTVAREPWRV